jgi:hypothetical protein
MGRYITIRGGKRKRSHIQCKQSLSSRSLELRGNFQTHRWSYIWEDSENRVISHILGPRPPTLSNPRMTQCLLLLSDIKVALFLFAGHSFLANNLRFMVKLIVKTIVINGKIHNNKRKRFYSSNKEGLIPHDRRV